MENSKQILMSIWQQGLFTSEDTFEVYIKKMCQRYARVYGEILNTCDYDLIIKKLKEKGEL